ncbi:MAG: exonuclease domain-containing protein [Betaproteobacteria bacterium]
MNITARRIAFVDLETTGLGPSTHRVAEIGVVTLDPDGTQAEWTTLVNPGRLPRAQRAVDGVTDRELYAAPRFAEVATHLAGLLAGRMVVAHNARFDYAFLKAEFTRAGVPFEAPALCTVMLSRKLFPHEANHHLDALIERHGLQGGTRHRALPDARVLSQFWRVLEASVPAPVARAAIDKLLAEPLLPPHLDLDLVLALPEKPGVYAMRDRQGSALRIARAANLRREVRDYFRLDRISARGAQVAYDVRNIEWQECDGELSSRLAEIALEQANATSGPGSGAPSWSIRVDPDSPWQVAHVAPAEEVVARGQALFGLFASERKARNTLSRLANDKGVCHGLLGLDRAACRTCGADAQACMLSRPQNLARALTAVATLRLQPWPYAGAVGVREGRTVHVFDQWQLLGSARTATEVEELAGVRPRGFDPAMFQLLSKALPRLASRRLKTLSRSARAARAAAHPNDPARVI